MLSNRSRLVPEIAEHLQCSYRGEFENACDRLSQSNTESYFGTVEKKAHSPGNSNSERP
jgi:hypothetical protein